MAVLRYIVNQDNRGFWVTIYDESEVAWTSGPLEHERLDEVVESITRNSPSAVELPGMFIIGHRPSRDRPPGI